jgi:hypothetical protein
VASLQWVNNLTDPTQVAAVAVNSEFEPGAVQIITGNISELDPNPEFSWVFNSSGNLVLPVDKYIKYPDGTIYGGSGSGTVNIEIDGGFPSSIFDETSLVIDGGVV